VHGGGGGCFKCVSAALQIYLENFFKCFMKFKLNLG
jgi:hypothetical protein